jgi:hypothetical protein
MMGSMLWIYVGVSVGTGIAFSLVSLGYSYWRGKPFEPSQFSLRSLFFMIAICAAFIATIQTLDRIHTRLIQESQSRMDEAIRANNLKTEEAIRELRRKHELRK